MNRLVVLVLLVTACGTRAVAVDGAPAAALDSSPSSRDQRGMDVPVTPDRLRLDGAAGFCASAPRLRVGDQELAVTGVKASLATMASCCEPGATVEVSATDTSGAAVKVIFAMLRFPNTPPVTHLDLASPPSGWVLLLYCEGPSGVGLCGAQRLDTEVTLTGAVEVSAASAVPAEDLTVCLTATPKPGAQAKAVQLSVSKLRLNLACTPGMDQTCNEDSLISSLRGKCNDDGTCTCDAGATKIVSTGKCK